MRDPPGLGRMRPPHQPLRPPAPTTGCPAASEISGFVTATIQNRLVGCGPANFNVQVPTHITRLPCQPSDLQDRRSGLRHIKHRPFRISCSVPTLISFRSCDLSASNFYDCGPLSFRRLSRHGLSGVYVKILRVIHLCNSRPAHPLLECTPRIACCVEQDAENSKDSEREIAPANPPSLAPSKTTPATTANRITNMCNHPRVDIEEREGGGFYAPAHSQATEITCASSLRPDQRPLQRSSSLRDDRASRRSSSRQAWSWTSSRWNYSSSRSSSHQPS